MRAHTRAFQRIQILKYRTKGCWMDVFCGVFAGRSEVGGSQMFEGFLLHFCFVSALSWLLTCISLFGFPCAEEGNCFRRT